MEVYRAVRQRFSPGEDLLALMRAFQLMLNDCLRLGLELEPPTYIRVKEACYARMLDYPVDLSYRVSAIYDATNLLKKYRTDLKTGSDSRPFCRRPYFSTSIGTSLEGDSLRLPGGFRLPLNAHTASILSREGNRLVSASVNSTGLSVLYKRDVAPIATTGTLGLDLNLENITTCDDEGRIEVYSLSQLAQDQERYRRITSRFRRRDARVRRRVFRKYSDKKCQRRDWILHNITSLIVNRATALRQKVAMEDLGGMRQMYRKESEFSSYYLSQMNSWPYGEIQRQIAYKAKWAGLPVVIVGAEGTSSNCSDCGGLMKDSPAGERILTCTICGLVIDRDVNAAKRILSRAARSAAVGHANEAMEEGVSRGSGTALKVDAGNSASQAGWKRGSKYS